MTEIAILDNKTHKDIKVDVSFKKGLGYDKGAVMIVPSEILAAQREYPILFRKHPETGRFFLNLLLGFKQDENLFLSNDGTWQASYIPLSFKKGPFLIGFKTEDGVTRPLLSIDLGDPRVGAGLPIYGKDGKLDIEAGKMADAVALLQEGYEITHAMVDAFVDAELIEPVAINIELNSGEKINFEGAYTVSEEKLGALSADSLFKLNQTGYLSAAYYIAGSLNNVKSLVDRKNNNSL